MADEPVKLVWRDVEGNQGDSIELRDQDADQRDQSARRRDENAAERDIDGQQRDIDGVRRDIDGEQRDQTADERDLESQRRDVDADARDERERETERRDLVDADSSSQDEQHTRRLSSLRERAAADRRRAMRDRGEAAAERGQARLDRGTALANRVAGASGRQSAGWDRDTASDDRAASATDRLFAQLDERFRELVDNVDAGFALRVIDPPAHLYLNPAYFKIFGFDPSGRTPTPAELMSLIHPDDRAWVGSTVDGVADRAPVEQEWRVVLADGVQRWVSARISPVTDEDGVVRRIACLFTDVTDRKAADAALRDVEERLEQLARSTEVGFFVREQATMVYMNKGLFRILALDPDMPNPTMAHIESMIHPLDRGLSATATAGADRNESTQVELRIIRPDGEIRWIRETNDPVATTDNGPIRVAGTITDITERKAAQLEAEHANAAKDEFLSRISHELRTPLNAVLGFAQLLELDELTPSQHQAVGHIVRGGRHLLAMINDVLDISVMESDRLELSLEPVQIGELIRDTLGLMRPLATAGGIATHFDPELELTGAFVLADHRRLRQVLLNLLSNAIKYNRQHGRIDIAVALVGVDQLAVSITDTGIGIHPEDLPRLFNRFDRLQQPSAVEGTGLGLALSQRLTTLMGGRLDVASTPGRGSTFTVTMPLSDPPGMPPSPADAPIDEERPPPPLSTLLYIEDNSSNVDLLTGLLRRRPGWTMTHAGTGGLGLELATATAPTVIVLDLHLPDINGIDVLKTLQANPRTCGIPVAILSADATRTQVNRLLAAGAQKYFTKPIDVAEVFAFLDAHALTAASLTFP